jgi:hypothetical protein
MAYVVPGLRFVTLIDVPEGVPMEVPSRKTSYPVTPTLSVEALQVNVKLVWVTAEEASPEGTEGACVSGTVRQKSSRYRLPCAPVFHTHILALTAPDGTACVDD